MTVHVLLVLRRLDQGAGVEVVGAYSSEEAALAAAPVGEIMVMPLEVDAPAEESKR